MTVPLFVVVLCLVYLISRAGGPRDVAGPFKLTEFAKLPVSYKGRVKPIDTVARNCLLILSGRQVLRHQGERVAAIGFS